MSYRIGRSVAVLAVAWLGGSQVDDVNAAQFSARVIQGGPQGRVSDGRMYVTDGRSRLEVAHNGHEVINIVDQQKGVAWTLFPAQQTFLEYPAPAAFGHAPADPCQTLPGAECRLLGEERLSGRAAGKWEVRIPQGGRTLVGTQWIDKERHTLLRSDMPGGQHTETNFLGMETVEGRRVEKWESLSSGGSLAPVRSFQWYDPELKLMVRQELPGGYSSELKDIRVEEQPVDLFRVPEGFRPAMTAGPGLSQRP